MKKMIGWFLLILPPTVIVTLATMGFASQFGIVRAMIFPAAIGTILGCIFLGAHLTSD
jgi:hypothetical protein